MIAFSPSGTFTTGSTDDRGDQREYCGQFHNAAATPSADSCRNCYSHL
nr:hypothetical protein [Xenorhabdus sp. Reich]